MKLSFKLLTSVCVVTSIAASSITPSVWAADLNLASKSTINTSPLSTIKAVSGLNGKLELGGGSLKGDGLGYTQGSITAPVGNNFGLQVDGLVGSWNSNFIGGASAHGFWRNPNIALLGLYGSYTYSDQRFGPVGAGGKSGIHIGRIGPEVELYFNRLSFEANVGVEGGDIKNRLYSFSDIALYPIDNARISIGHRFTGEKNMGAIAAEYLTPYSFGGATPAVFAEARAGEDDYRAVYGGVRFYFGEPNKTLINRHRQDDPRPRIADELFGIISAKAEKLKKFLPASNPLSGSNFNSNFGD